MADQLYEESAVLKQITKFYDQPLPERNPQLCKVNIERESPLNADQETSTALEVLLNLPKLVQMCFAALIQYLQDFKLEKILRLTRCSCNYLCNTFCWFCRMCHIACLVRLTACKASYL